MRHSALRFLLACAVLSAFVFFLPVAGRAEVPGTPPVPFRFNQPLSRGMRGKAIIKLQEALTRLGAYRGPVTGYFGPLTQAAVRELQRKNGFEPAGVVGPKTRGVLNAKLAAEVAVLSSPSPAPSPSSSVSPSPSPSPSPQPPPPSPTPSPSPSPSPSASPSPSPSAAPRTSAWINIRFTDFTGGSSYGEKPGLAWYPNGYGVVWVGSDGIQDAENIFFARINLVGTRTLDPVRLTQHNPCACTTAYAPHVAWNGKFAAVWVENAVVGSVQEGPSLRFAILEDNGGKSKEVTVAAPSAAPSTKRPTIKARADHFDITWEKSDGTRMYAALTLDGNVFYTNPRVATDAEWDGVNIPAFDGRAVEEDGSIYYTRGMVREFVSAVAGENTAPDITFSSTHAIVWQNKDNNITQLYFAARPGGAGVAPRANLAVSPR